MANRLTRVANLILESREEPPDIEREAHRFGRPVEMPGSSFKAGDVISVPPEVIRVTRFRTSSRLVIKRRKAGQRPGECKGCGAVIETGDLYAARHGAYVRPLHKVRGRLAAGRHRPEGTRVNMTPAEIADIEKYDGARRAYQRIEILGLGSVSAYGASRWRWRGISARMT